MIWAERAVGQNGCVTMRILQIIALSCLAVLGGPALASSLVEPSLHVIAGGPDRPRIALTFDACEGRTDQRILGALVDNRIPATIFATARWLSRNSAAVAILQAHPDLFQVENHGARHIPAVDRPMSVYGLAAAGSPAAVLAEAQGGADAIKAAGFATPKWFRGATAKYTTTSLAEIRSLDLGVAGYSVNGDGGAQLSAGASEKRLLSARDGDVVLAHINQPGRTAGAGVVRGILALKARGVQFVHLDDGGPGPAATAKP